MSDAKCIYLISVEDPESEDGAPIDQGYFSTRELAEEAMARHPDQRWVEILEIPLDQCVLEMPSAMAWAEAEDVPPKTIYEVILNIIYNEKHQERVYECRAGKIRPGGFVIRETDQYGGHYDNVTVESEVSMEHAMQIAVDARRKFIADRAGLLPYDPDWHLKPRFSEGT